MNNIYQQYKSAKTIVNFISNGDNKSELAQKLRKEFTIQQLIDLNLFIDMCIDAGVPSLAN